MTPDRAARSRRLSSDGVITKNFLNPKEIHRLSPKVMWISRCLPAVESDLTWESPTRARCLTYENTNRQAGLIRSRLERSLALCSSGPYGQKKWRSEEHTSELQSRGHLVCRLLLEK